MSPEPADAGLALRLDEALTRTTTASSAPGVQAALVHDGVVAWSGCHGTVDISTGEPVTDDHVFCLASVGKTLLASVVLHLGERGDVDLDEPIASVLGDDVPGSRAVTPRMLLAHTSGYPDLYGTPQVAALMPPDEDEPGSGASYEPGRPFTWEMLLPGILEPVAPAQQWEYSNAGYIVLTEVLQRVLGGPDGLAALWDSMAARASAAITDDMLTMHRSRVRPGRLVHGYAEHADGSLVDPYAGHLTVQVPCDLFGLPFGDGLFAGTATGVASFLDGLFVRRTVLEPSTLVVMTATTPQAAAADVPEPSLATYGLGTYRMEGGGAAWQGHRGTYGGFNVVAASDAERGNTLAVLTNVMGEQSQASRIWRSLAEVVAPT